MSLVLHKLIHSLTSSEKVYFIRTTSIHAKKKGKNYLRIYRTYEKLKEYDPVKLSEAFKGTNIEIHLSSELNYLKEKILVSLFNYNMNRSKRNKIQKGIILIEALASKGLQKDALKKLRTIKKSAFVQEEFTWILRLIELEENILFKEGAIGYKTHLEQLNKQRNEVTMTIQNLNQLHLLRQEIRELQFNEDLFNDNGQIILQSLYSDPIISNKSNCKSIKAQDHWYYIQVLLSYLSNDYTKGLIISDEYVKFLYGHLNLFPTNKLLPVLSNYVFHACLTQNKNHFEAGIRLINNVPIRKKSESLYREYILSSRHMEYYYFTKDKEHLEEVMNSTSELIDLYSEYFEESQLQYLYMLLVRASIINKQYDRGMQYCNKWFRRGVLTFRKTQARLFLLLIIFKLGHFQLAESKLTLLKRMKFSRPVERQLIKLFYSFFFHAIKIPNDIEAPISALIQGLSKIQPQDQRIFEMFISDYQQWTLNHTI